MPMTLNDLEVVTTSYEDMPVPFDPALRRNVGWSLASISASLVLLWALPSLVYWSQSSGFFLALGGVFIGILDLILAVQPLIITINVVALLLCVLLFRSTNNLEAGSADWHKLAMAENYVGAINGGIMALEVAILVGNLILWIIIGILAVVLAFVFLAALAAGA